MLKTPHQAKLNIVARTNGVGLDRDVDLIREAALAGGYEVTISHCRAISPFRKWFPGKARFDANIFLERAFPRWFGQARKNILVPNQERFPKRHLPLLKKIDHIFCKSQHALEIFQKHHHSCHFTGFTSVSLHNETVQRKQLGILHLAGKSTLKGTETILELWKKHPEWPPLTLVQCQENTPTDIPENVTLISEYLTDEEIERIYNEHPIHLCPSRSEGWGHYLVEAMHCGALVITTDGPPMNELIRPDRGYLVKARHTEPRHLGTNYHVDEKSLERAIETALSTPIEKRQRFQKEGQNWAAANHLDFQDRLLRVLSEVLPS